MYLNSRVKSTKHETGGVTLTEKMKFPAEHTVMCLLGPCINEISEIKTVIYSQSVLRSSTITV